MAFRIFHRDGLLTMRGPDDRLLVSGSVDQGYQETAMKSLSPELTGSPWSRVLDSEDHAHGVGLYKM
jgi:hypothetical protein